MRRRLTLREEFQITNGTMPARKAAELKGRSLSTEASEPFNVGGIDQRSGEYARVMALQETAQAAGNLALNPNPSIEQ